MVEKLIPIFNDIRKSGIEGKRARKNFAISLIIFIISIAIVFDFYGILLDNLNESKTYRTQLCNYDVSSEDIKKWESLNANVPDYDAEIKVKAPINVISKSKLEFSLNVKDTGILKLEKPYFYIFLIDPDKKIVAMFPFFYAQYSTEPSCDAYKPTSVYNSRSKWNPWQYSEYNQKTFYVSTDKGKAQFSRNQLMGNSTEAKIVFEYLSVGKEGEWEINVVLFDEEYKTRANYYIPEDVKDNAVKIETVKFNVVHSSFEDENMMAIYILKLLTLLSLLGAFFIAPYYILKKFGDKIEKNVRENFWGYLIVLILILLSLLLTKYM